MRPSCAQNPPFSKKATTYHASLRRFSHADTTHISEALTELDAHTSRPRAGIRKYFGEGFAYLCLVNQGKGLSPMVAVAGKSVLTGYEETITALWNEGQSDEDIARTLSLELQKSISRLTVLGFRTRMGLRRENHMKHSRPVNFKNMRPKQPKSVVLSFRKPSTLDTPEPEAIGPIEDFPACGCCRYTSDNPLQPNWKMCGQPVDTKRRGDNYPWCDWHRDNVIYNSQAKASA